MTTSKRLPQMDGAVELQRVGNNEMDWGARVAVPYDPPEGVYEAVAKQVWRSLQDTLSIGWQVVDGPHVDEDMDFMRNQTTIMVRVRLRWVA